MNERTKSAIGAAFSGGAAAGILHLILARPRRGQRLERERLAVTVGGAVAGALLSLLYDSPGPKNHSSNRGFWRYRRHLWTFDASEHLG